MVISSVIAIIKDVAIARGIVIVTYYLIQVLKFLQSTIKLLWNIGFIEIS